MTEAQALLSSAHSAYRRADFQEARVACLAALEQDPNSADAWMLKGVLARLNNEFEPALAAYAEALRLRPQYPEACFNLGNLLATLGRSLEAITQFERAVSFNPALTIAWSGLGTQRLQVNHIVQGIAALRQAATLAPDQADVWNNLGRGFWMAGEVEAAVASFRKALALQPDNVLAHDNLLTLLHYDPRLSPADLLEEHLVWNQRHAVKLKTEGGFGNRSSEDPERRLRLGLVSWNFRRDAAGCFIASILHGINRSQFEVFAYSDNPARDAYTEDFSTYVDTWVESHALDDAVFSQRVQADAIDILVDLTGHTGRNRLLAFARRLAPLQISWIGYEGSTGLGEMDALIGDWQVTPPAASAHCSEQLIRLPFAFQCFMPPADAPAVAPPPCRIKGYITFGCFNKPAKLNAAVLTTWARLLQRLPDARLLLKSSVFADPDLCEVFWQRFELLGVSRQRVMLRGASSYLVMLADYAEVDIALDPFPFSGGATTCDALWMGLPMITLRGERFAANHTVSHLIASGFPQWIAEDEAAYVDIAARLAAELLDDPASLGELRATQRSLMAASPLCDAKSYMVRVELELRRLWRAHCAMRLG